MGKLGRVRLQDWTDNQFVLWARNSLILKEEGEGGGGEKEGNQKLERGGNGSRLAFVGRRHVILLALEG